MKTIALPQDLEGAHALILQLHARVHEMQGTIEDLRHRVDVMARRMFGRRSEQLSPDQMDLAFAALKAEDEAIEAAAAGVEPETDAADEVEREAPVRARKGHGRRRLSPDLVREERVLEPDSTLCPCCGLTMARIGEERSEQLDYVPSSLRVVETVRPTYACGRCKEGVISAPPPEAPVVRGKASAALMAHVAVSKYADHRVPRRHAQQPKGRRSKLCCMEDEGRSLGIGVQARVPNHLELRGSRVRVVSVEGKGAARPRQVGSKKTSGSEPLMTCREVSTRRRNRAGWLARDESRGSLSTDWTASGMKVA